MPAPQLLEFCVRKYTVQMQQGLAETDHDSAHRRGSSLGAVSALERLAVLGEEAQLLWLYALGWCCHWWAPMPMAKPTPGTWGLVPLLGLPQGRCTKSITGLMPIMCTSSSSVSKPWCSSRGAEVGSCCCTCSMRQYFRPHGAYGLSCGCSPWCAGSEAEAASRCRLRPCCNPSP